jgi:hypothetical protein
MRDKQGKNEIKMKISAFKGTSARLKLVLKNVTLT